MLSDPLLTPPLGAAPLGAVTLLTKRHTVRGKLTSSKYLLSDEGYGHDIATELGRLCLLEATYDPLSIRALESHWVTSLSQRGLAPATVSKAHQIVSAVLAQAVDDRLIASNPAAMVNNLPRVPASRRRALTDDEVADRVAVMDPRYKAIVLLGAFAGLRPGELVALRVSRVDVLRRIVEVAETATDVGGQVIVGPPKTDRGVRSVPIPAAVAEVLAQHIGTLGSSERGPILFPAPGGGYLRLNGFRARFWQPAVKAAGIEGKVTPHMLRHTAVTRWIREGTDLPTAAKRAGHDEGTRRPKW